MLLFLASRLVFAGCPEEAPSLGLGDRAWVVEGGVWGDDTHTVAFRDGLAFEVVREGAPVGVVVVGDAVSSLRDTSGTLLDALRRELDLTVPVGPTWDTPVDIAWRLGAPIGGSEGAADVAVPPSWLSLRVDRAGPYGVGADGVPFVLVYEDTRVATMRATAARAVADRARALADAGYPLESVVALAPSGWSLLEARTTAQIGALAGLARINPDPWLTTLHDDLTIDGGRRVATVSFGTRYVEGLSGC